MRCAISIAAIGMALMAGCARDGGKVAAGAGPDAAAGGYRWPVTVAEVGRERTVFPLRVSGTLAPDSSSRLSFLVAGVIGQCLAEDGQRVSKGQVLARLDQRQIQAQADQAKAALDKAGRDLERAQSLYDQKVASLEQLQNARTARDVAATNEEMASFALERSVIVAPADGTVVRRLAEQGEAVGAGAPVFAFASRAGGWRLRVMVSDRDFVAVRRGDRATVRMSAWPDRAFTAYVADLAEAPDPTTGLFEIRLAFDGDPAGFVSGLFGTAEIESGAPLDCFVVPPEAVVDENGGEAKVFVPDPSGGSARARRVRIARMTDSKVYLTKGLEGVPSVVARGAAFLSDGSPISVEAGAYGKAD